MSLRLSVLSRPGFWAKPLIRGSAISSCFPGFISHIIIDFRRLEGHGAGQLTRQTPMKREEDVFLSPFRLARKLCWTHCQLCHLHAQFHAIFRVKTANSGAIWKDTWNAPKNKAFFTKAGEGKLQRGTRIVCSHDKSFCGFSSDYIQYPEKLYSRKAFSSSPSLQVKSKQRRQALETCQKIAQGRLEPKRSTLVALLKVCCSLQDLEVARGVHAVLAVCGRCFKSDVYLGTMLVDMYAKCGSLVDARLAFEKMSAHNVVSWSALIWGYASGDEGEEALHLFARMQQEGVTPNDRTYVSALKACSAMVASGVSKQVCLQHVRSIHALVVKSKFQSDLYVGNMLVDAYAKCGKMEDAWMVFEAMPLRDVVSWNVLIFGYVQTGKKGGGIVALQLYDRMKQSGVVPNERTYVSALKACSTMAAERNGADGVAVKKDHRHLEMVRSIHSVLVDANCKMSLYVRNMLVDAYAKCGSLAQARREFEQIPCRDVVSWNAMILGYAQMGKGEEALQMYARMQQEGVARNDRTFVSALKACSIMGESEEMLPAHNDGTAVASTERRWFRAVQDIHRDAIDSMVEADPFVGNMLVDAYAKCGRLKDALLVFEKMPCRTLVSWNAMILGYARMDRGGEALTLFTRMQQAGVAPDGRTYVSALNACASVGDLERGKIIHAQILEAGLLATDSYLTDSLISMYGKCGSMWDARRLFDELVGERGIVSWNALIAGYANNGESEVVFDLFEKMQQEGVQPDHITFLAVLTVSSHVGLVDTGERLFLLMTSSFGIAPSIKHFICLIDLLSRSGQLEKAMEIVHTMPFTPNSAVWGCVLNGCRKWGDVELGKLVLECAVKLNKDDAAAYVAMANIYAAAHMRQEAQEMQEVRLSAQAWKQPGWSRWTDPSGYAHVFVMAGHSCAESQDIYFKLGSLLVEMEEQGCVARLPLC